MSIPVEVDKPRTFTRTEAIQLLTMLEASQFDDDYEELDLANMSNEDLEEELCMSGVVHDNDMLGVVDDAV